MLRSRASFSGPHSRCFEAAKKPLRRLVVGGVSLQASHPSTQVCSLPSLVDTEHVSAHEPPMLQQLEIPFSLVPHVLQDDAVSNSFFCIWVMLSSAGRGPRSEPTSPSSSSLALAPASPPRPWPPPSVWASRYASLSSAYMALMRRLRSRVIGGGAGAATASAMKKSSPEKPFKGHCVQLLFMSLRTLLPNSSPTKRCARRVV